MGLFSKIADKIEEKIDQAQKCTSCGCGGGQWCDNCTVPDCDCAGDQ